MNIYEKMSAITSELSAVAKNLTVGEGRSSYKAVGEADVLAAVKPLEVKYKVYSYPVSRKVIDTNIMTTTSTYNGNTKETQKLFMRIETVYRFVNIEKPEEYIDITTYGDGVDSQDKATGKAMTYADKYALLKAYKIITGDDPDQNKSEEGKFEAKPKLDRKNNEPSPTGITAGGVDYITELCIQTGTDPAKVMAGYKVKSFFDLTMEQYNAATKVLEGRLKKIENQALADAAQERLINGDL